jgi:tagatose 1,6-diphosphate aldolase
MIDRRMELSPGKLWGMRRMADAAGRFKMTAVDQRPPIVSLVARHYGTADAPYDDVAGIKALLIETLQAGSSAMLLDPNYAVPRGIDLLSPQKGLIVTLEDSDFRESEGGRFSAAIGDWSVAKIKRMGGDAVKVLAWYRPDAGRDVRRHQQDFVRRIGEECRRCDIPFLLELLLYPLPGDAHQTRDYVEMRGKRADDVLRSVETFAAPEYGVDVFKLESPVNTGDVPGVGNDDWEAVQAVFDEMGRLAGRPWVMLSAGAGQEAFRNILTHAYRAGASGYLAGRAIWQQPMAAFPDWQLMRAGLSGASVAYVGEISALTDREAAPWFGHPCYGGEGGRFHPRDDSFRQAYPGFGGDAA